ncbi:amidase [Ceratobasidium sp. AG-I]|nr:amidase [Ceratobasidium sp. AG-I]
MSFRTAVGPYRAVAHRGLGFKPHTGVLAQRRRFLSTHVTPRINGDRLNRTLHETCEFGAGLRFGPGPTETGMARLSLDDNDAKVRRWLIDQTIKLGCKITIDQMGNIFAVRPGQSEGPPTAMGSHLDTQPTGGRYDGILGIMAGLEALRVLYENKIDTRYPVALVNWTNEEGARFPRSVVSSGVWAGNIPIEMAWRLPEVGSTTVTMRSELERIGFLGEAECSHSAMPLGAHFELHIEQGPILEGEQAKIGIVKGAQAYRWFTLDITGRASHTGTTPFPNRSDALLCAAKIMVASATIGKRHGGLSSTGILTLSPGSTNTSPGYVSMTIDMRHRNELDLDKIEAELRDEAELIATAKSEKGCNLKWTKDFESPAIIFDEGCIESVRASAIEVVGRERVREVYSGAGHDSCATSTRCPTSMIFVPSRGGLSHNPLEYTSPGDCALGAQVLLQSVLRYDSLRS